MLRMSAGEIDQELNQGHVGFMVLHGLKWAGTCKHHRQDLRSTPSSSAHGGGLRGGQLRLPGMLHGLRRGLRRRAAQAQGPGQAAGRPKSGEREASERLGFTWAAFLEQAVYAGLKPDEFWGMTPAEVVVWVEGFEHRHDLAGQMMAHFFSYLGAVSGNWGKMKRPPKARDLWNSRRKRPEKDKNVVDLAEHRRWSEAFKETGPPPIFRRGG